MMQRDYFKIATFIIVPAFVGVAVWWLESRFGSLTAILVVGTVVGALFFTAGAFLSHSISKSTMASMAEFSQKDAMTDRYRMQTFREQARGDAALQKAAAQLTLIDAKRVDQIAQQRARALTDGIDRQQPAASNDLWSWDDDQPSAKGGASYQVWE